MIAVEINDVNRQGKQQNCYILHKSNGNGDTNGDTFQLTAPYYDNSKQMRRYKLLPVLLLFTQQTNEGVRYKHTWRKHNFGWCFGQWASMFFFMHAAYQKPHRIPCHDICCSHLKISMTCPFRFQQININWILCTNCMYNIFKRSTLLLYKAWNLHDSQSPVSCVSPR